MHLHQKMHMKTQTKQLGILFFIIVVGVFRLTTCAAQSSETDDKTLSPYFFIKSDDASVDQLPLKSTKAQVGIAGVIADVLVFQEYKNEGKKPIEAVYVFPASTRAAVHHMRMKIDFVTLP
jgi:Ca-activated chloride channel family protein